MQANFTNEGLFPKRGKELNFVINGKSRIVRGELGEAAVVMLNDVLAGVNASIQANDKIVVKESTAGADAVMEIRKLPEYESTLQVIVNDQKVVLPKFAEVNGQLQSGFYEIMEHDDVKILNYYTVQQIIEFMDVILKEDTKLYVNNKLASSDEKVYENFSLIWTMEEVHLSDVEEDMDGDASELYEEDMDGGTSESYVEDKQEHVIADEAIIVTVNQEPVHMVGKNSYIYVDVFDLIHFDLSQPRGKSVVTLLNGAPAQYTEVLKNGDVLDIYWKD